MNAAAAGNGPDESRLRDLFTEISNLKTERADLIRKLTACQRENRQLKTELAELRESE